MIRMCEICDDFMEYNCYLLHHPTMKVEITCSKCGKIFTGG